MSKNPHCPVHVSVEMREETQHFHRHAGRAGHKNIGRSFYRCPVQGCSRVESVVKQGSDSAVFGWFGADVMHDSAA